MQLFRKTVLLFGHSGALGGAVADAFAAARWRVIGCGPRALPDAKKIAGTGLFSNGEQPSPPHETIELKPSDFNSLQAQGEYLARELQPLLASGPPLHAAICCSGAFACSPVSSEAFLAETERLFQANCLPALLCAHTAAVLFRNRQDTPQTSQDTVPPLVVLTGAAAVSSHPPAPTPGMIGYGCAKVFVHHLVRSLAATQVEKGFLGAKGGADSPGEPQSPPIDFRVVGILPTVLDTPANRDCMRDVPDEEKENSWTKVEEIAEKLVKWADGEEAVENGGLYVVRTEKGKTTFLVPPEA
ncbi:Novel protein similar to quinoid dihydropteridine reductase (QDPR, zgc:112405), related [Neospora caninum Liverpool]|uniref:Novel protein similar to quinoid dihydropteridine reductase (QDPR, zgc:112405), related n=1 Tax=Neospora caninum (strain Liverpool) TaxID=572307 RepID=F0VDF4_NEOCL|nr:Novel protein similar to quinoid dihydropteridine reductase (QDPR, zgc:112405), related [Neospora caninum Liverpool]CBZ51669.1 Novel protein similar to quinoid dihydropteridine reductase (QDPR, zgc:112405), related [Neospora caninum Liverpool]CEL65623.1 TPA: Novel protein similar to quinoid dihydropteridine reductase (QDPR, zgc:112405), related [Neospora caninum Liverpool]|eukprot:XP_003881702.1 Novel protein similar to quinoid dihydropteridine reductase (QDPR, zgc:112405), related [Neospora caninum Liverpool]